MSGTSVKAKSSDRQDVMNTYKLVSGETIRYPDPPPPVAAFLARVRLAAQDPTVSIGQMIDLVYGPDNPLLDHTVFPGRGMVTVAVHADPVYRVMRDQLAVKEIAAGLYDPAEARKAYTLSVPAAAKQLGISPAAVRLAISNQRLAAVYDNGQWWIRPSSVASYKVSNRGPKAAGRPRRQRIATPRKKA
jgi:hypothetical protein